MASILDTLDRPHRGKYRPQKRMHPRERLARKSVRDESTGCLMWTGRLTSCGYGSVTIMQAGYPVATFSAHKVSYELARGRVPDGLVLDHLCRNRACIEPSHMEPVSQRENIMRSPIAQGALNAAKTHCAQGHEYSPENTYLYVSGPPRATTMRVCKTCRAEWSRKRHARKAEAVSA